MYGVVARPVRSSQSASAAFRLPVTGSSTVLPATGKKARTSKGRPARRVRPGHPDVQINHTRAHRQYRLGTRQQHRDPARAIVRPGQIHDVSPADAELGGDPLGQGLLDRAGPDHRRGGERQPRVGPPDLDQPGPALLHAPAGAGRWPPASSQAWQVPRVGCPANGSSASRGEDPHLVVRLLAGRGSTKVVSDRFIQVANCCMPPVLSPSVVEHDGERVCPGTRLGAEHIDLRRIGAHSPSLLCRGRPPGPPDRRYTRRTPC